MDNTGKIDILIACEFSGIVREAFRALGYNAWSCDLLPSEIPGKYHIQKDVLTILNKGWAAMIAFPPCTYICLSGNGTYAGTKKHLNDVIIWEPGTPQRNHGIKF